MVCDRLLLGGVRTMATKVAAVPPGSWKTCRKVPRELACKPSLAPLSACAQASRPGQVDRRHEDHSLSPAVLAEMGVAGPGIELEHTNRERSYKIRDTASFIGWKLRTCMGWKLRKGEGGWRNDE